MNETEEIRWNPKNQKWQMKEVWEMEWRDMCRQPKKPWPWQRNNIIRDKQWKDLKY